MARPCVFLDTNCVNSSDLKRFLGNRNEVSRLARDADILLPRIVRDELIEHKRRFYEGKITELRKNPLLGRLGVSDNQLSSLSFQTIKSELLQDMSIPYEVWHFSDPSIAIETAYSLAVGNKAPFDKGSDKGFKDVCIALTVDDYVSKHSEVSSVYLISNDARLREYFEDSSAVKTFEDIASYLKCAVTAEQETRHEVLPVADQSENEATTAVDGANKQALIKGLCSSRSFSSTHDYVTKLSQGRYSFTRDESVLMLKAAVSNNQIGWILSDEDILDFYLPLFRQYEELLSDEEYHDFVDSAGIPSERIDKGGNPTFSRVELRAYATFVDGLLSHIQDRDISSYIEKDYLSVEPKLTNLVRLSNLDPNAASWNDLASVFIVGGVRASSKAIDAGALKGFMSLMGAANDLKRETVMNGICARLESVDYYIPF